CTSSVASAMKPPSSASPPSWRPLAPGLTGSHPSSPRNAPTRSVVENDGLMDLLHALTLGDVVREHRRSYPERTAVVCGDTRLTWPQLDDRVSRLANALAASGVKTGDRILWLGQNCHRVLEAMLAAAKIGAVFCPANWRQTAEELTFVVDDVDARVVIWQQEEIGEAARAARADATSKGRWLQHDAGGDGSYEAFLASGAPDDPGLDVDAADPVLMLYTAAFAGRPNGALLSHTAITTQ